VPILELRDMGKTLIIPFTPGLSVRDILDTTSTRVRSGCNGNGACGLCKVRIEAGYVHEPTAKEHYFIGEPQCRRGVRLACQVVPDRDLTIEILSLARKSLWRSLLAEDIFHIREDVRISGITGSDATHDGDVYGIAVDIGTTQISLSLLSLGKGCRLAARCGPNPQGDIGADVMTRLVAASGSRARAGEMSARVVRAIGEGIHDIASREGIDLGLVTSLALEGNTAMLALLTERNYELLVRPETWVRTIDCTPENTGAWKTMWGVPDTTTVEVLPPAGGFVGSDLPAGVLATGLAERGKPGLLIDFGTNTEIGLWDGRTLLVTSAAGGPAFEGSGIRCGLPAEPGAICRVRFAGGITEYQTIAGEKARGLCGTGIIDLIAGLVRSQILTEKGRFASGYAETGFVLSAGDPALVLEKKDVDLFQRAKAAVGTGIQILTDEAGIGFQDLDRVFVGGTFGKALDVVNAMEIGLLPPLPPDRIELCGNTALAGCELALLSTPAFRRLRWIGEQTRVINLVGHRHFDDIYLENLYLRPLEGR
jgi:uncharacterized 2Fe-2S/4Fe-4S cluster protein (DUF4445 family)